MKVNPKHKIVWNYLLQYMKKTPNEFFEQNQFSSYEGFCSVLENKYSCKPPKLSEVAQFFKSESSAFDKLKSVSTFQFQPLILNPIFENNEEHQIIDESFSYVNDVEQKLLQANQIEEDLKIASIVPEEIISPSILLPEEIDVISPPATVVAKKKTRKKKVQKEIENESSADVE